MRRFHSQESQRIRARRAKEARRWRGEEWWEEWGSKRNQNKELEGIGGCGNKKCATCYWDKFLPSEKLKRQRREGQLQYMEEVHPPLEDQVIVPEWFDTEWNGYDGPTGWQDWMDYQERVSG